MPAVIVKCRCGVVARLTGGQHAAYVKSGKSAGWSPHSAWAHCWACGKELTFSEVKATLAPEVACDSRCWKSTGPSCTCSCGGEHHGRAHG